MKIALLIRALERGGAERQLVNLAEGLAGKGHEVHVLSFYADGALLPDLRDAGVPVRVVGKRGRGDMTGFFARLVGALRDIAPEVLYTSMPAANIAGCLAGRLAGRPAVVWRVAASEMDLGRYHWFSGLSYRVEALCASMPALVIANSHAGREAVLKQGYAPDKVKVVWNGICTDWYRPDAELGAGRKRQWGLDAGKWTIGQVARSDPKKGYEDFIDAATMLCDRRDDVQFLGVGVGSDGYGRRLRERAERQGIGERITWRGLEKDMLAAYNAMDINTLSSRFGEGCPNAVAEAMACGVPCVVTDVGDSARIVARPQQVVSPESPEALAEAWARLLDRLDADRASVARESRERVVESLSVERYIDETESLLVGVR